MLFVPHNEYIIMIMIMFMYVLLFKWFINLVKFLYIKYQNIILHEFPIPKNIIPIQISLKLATDK